MEIFAEIIEYPHPYGNPPKCFRNSENALNHYPVFVKFNLGKKQIEYEFEGCFTDFSMIRKHPMKDYFIIIAKGEGYLFDPYNENVLSNFAGDICGAKEISEEQIIFYSCTSIFSFGIYEWDSKRLSIDGLDKFANNGNILVCEAYNPMSDGWNEFSLDLASGKVISGYNCPF